jgi:hypothetical protein
MNNYVLRHVVCITDDGLTVEFSGTLEECAAMRDELATREHAQMASGMARYEVYYGWGCPCGASGYTPDWYHVCPFCGTERVVVT